MKEVVITSAVRTPIGSFLGQFAEVPATELGAAAIRAALEKSGLTPDQVTEVFMGQVVQAGAGQAPARQAALKAGIPDRVPCTTVNKVCASGMKAIMLAAQSIALGQNEVVVAGGMENMSLIPHYLPLRQGTKFGPAELVDGMQRDGLVDAYDQQAMGVCADLCASEHGFSREEQDQFAIQSYTRSSEAWASGRFADEVIPVAVPQRKGDPLLITEDEEYKRVAFDKVPQLRPAFTKDGTVTAANASTINDGAAALVLTSREKAESLGAPILAVIRGYADAAQEPKWFTTAPAKAVPLAVSRAGLTLADMDFIELNEAFSVVGLANIKLLGLDPARVNVHGGAVSLGHPLGCSGARITVTLLHVLRQHGGRYGVAGICNGGGGASALVLERI